MNRIKQFLDRSDEADAAIREMFEYFDGKRAWTRPTPEPNKCGFCGADETDPSGACESCHEKIWEMREERMAACTHTDEEKFNGLCSCGDS